MAVGVRNDLTDVAAGPLADRGQPAGRSGAGLSRLTFVDSSGVHAVIDLAKRTERLGIRLSIVPGSRAVQRVFEICELTELLPFTTRM